MFPSVSGGFEGSDEEDVYEYEYGGPDLPAVGAWAYGELSRLFSFLLIQLSLIQ